MQYKLLIGGFEPTTLKIQNCTVFILTTLPTALLWQLLEVIVVRILICNKDDRLNAALPILIHSTFPITVKISFRVYNFYQSWYSCINNSRRLETYSLFKHTFTMEKYLHTIFDEKLRFAFARFRTSSHDLNIERGRYVNVPRQQRIWIVIVIWWKASITFY